jgi:hypothetical protein
MRTPLKALVEQGATANEIATLVNSLAPAEKLEQVLAVRGKLVGRLFRLVQGAEPLALGDVLGLATRAGETSIYEGRNSLPIFSRFQKRLTRTADGIVFGYNHQANSRITGPGYFVVREDETRKGEILFDYTQEPPFEPEGWPAYIPNEKGLSRLVYANMHDWVRKVANGVLVGSAFKLGVDQDAYFTLTVRVG